MTSADTEKPECILLAHGGGGERTIQLLRERILPPIQNDILRNLGDSAVFPWTDQELVFTTDSYVVTPLVFPGGDIGRLAVAGTVNDLAVMGAAPVALSLGLILEEGLPLAILDRVMASIAVTAKEAGVYIATGDTKVIERRRPPDGASADPLTPGAPGLPRAADPTRPAAAVDGLFINTAGVGRLLTRPRLEPAAIEAGDAVLISGRIAEHALAVMSVRSGIAFDSELRSDVAPLNRLVEAMLSTGGRIRFMRDATRGGLAGVLADVVEAARLSIEIKEADIPLSPTARHAAEMLGLEPLAMANEGKLVCIADPEDAPRILQAMRRIPVGRHAMCIGRVTSAQPPLVELLTRTGGRRIVQRPYGEDLPRIC